MEQQQPSTSQMLVALAYVLGLVALAVSLALMAHNMWVGVLVAIGLVGLQVIISRAAEGKFSGAVIWEIASLWMLTGAAQVAQYAGRWLWAAVFGLAGVILIAIGGAASAKDKWVSQGGFVLGIWSLIWAFVGPMWLYGKNQNETRDFFTSHWWALVAGVAIVVILAAILNSAAGRRRRAPGVRGPVRPLVLPSDMDENVMFGRARSELASPQPPREEDLPETPAVPEPEIELPEPLPGVISSDDDIFATRLEQEPGATVFAGRAAQGELLYNLPEPVVDLVSDGGDHYLLTEHGRLVRRHDGESGEVPGVALYRPLGLSIAEHTVVAADVASHLVSIQYEYGGSPHVHHHDVEAELACFALNPYGTIVAYAPTDGGIYAVVLDTGDRQLLNDDGAPTTAMAFSMDGRVLALGAADGSVRLFDMATRHVETTFAAPPGEHGEVVSLTHSANGGWIAGYASGRVVHWDDSGTLTGLVTEPHHVCSIAAEPGSGRVAVGCDDGFVIVHAGDLGAETFDSPLGAAPIVRVMFEDEHALVAAGRDGSVREVEL